ncbi:hypothetical protein M2419_003063 [Sphingobacterium sp. BIGb0116]|nr:hypothetical protein [Sphingobacterium sp. BIGb0116]
MENNRESRKYLPVVVMALIGFLENLSIQDKHHEQITE